MTGDELVTQYQQGERDFRGAYLRGAYLYAVNLEDANLEDANLYGADLRRANLQGADLSRATLRRADLRYVNLEGVIMNWDSHTLIGERLRQAAGEDYHKLALAGAVVTNPQHCWEWWLDNTPKPELQWALEVMRSWIKDGDNVPEELIVQEV
jgi:hypothetical protein